MERLTPSWTKSRPTCGHAALDIAATIIRLDPEDPLGWVNRSYALHELKRTSEARDTLLRVVDKFRTSATMPPLKKLQKSN